MNLRAYPPRLRPYLHHGISLQYHNGDTDGRGICPLCHESLSVWTNKPGHVCGCQGIGNIYSFLKTLYTKSCELYPDPAKYLQPLIQAKGLTDHQIILWGVVPSYITSLPLLPIYNEQEALANLAVIKKDAGKYRPFGTPNCKHHPFRVRNTGWFAVEGRRRSVWAPEGLWDTITLETFKRDNGLTHQVIGIPGTSTFKDEWFDSYFHDCDLTLMFDNDYRRYRQGKYSQPGKDGVERIIKLAELHKTDTTVSYLKWGDTTYASNKYPDGFDISDLAAAGSLTPQRIADMTAQGKRRSSPAQNAARSRQAKNASANKSTQNGKAPEAHVEPIHRTSFKDLCKDWSSRLHFSQNIQDTLAFGLAVVASTPLAGDQLWGRLIGPPGSGKTTVAEALSAARKYVYPLSLQTGFHSGHKDLSNPDEDFSLIKKMNGKTGIIKDGDVLLKASGLERILSEMRDFYDGVTRADYRNSVSHHYENLRITFLLCGTDALRTLNRTDVGERFIDCEIFGDDDAAPYVERAFQNTYNLVTGSMANAMDPEYNEASKKDTDYLKACTAGFINHLCTNMLKRAKPEMPESAGRSLKAMAQFLAIIRAKTKQDKETLEYVKARVEIPTRLISQFVKASITLAVVKERPAIDDEVLRCVRKIVFDTAESVELDIVQQIHNAEYGLSCRQIAHELALSERAILQKLQSLNYFGAVKRKPMSNNSGQRGRDMHLWQLSDLVQDVYAGSLDQAARVPSAIKKRMNPPAPKRKVKK